ncbi:hypothetical protein [Streptomyces sp. NPDC001315]|uniref:hypothetical protein n=1 Tax=Streptomyces sp. NPDC001315 TaxID=3364562 RepID=UPI0036C9E85E
MSSRTIRARLDRLAKALGEPARDAPVCRFHGTHCRLGINWPLPYPGRPEDDLLDLVAEARRHVGKEPLVHPRDLWATDRHEQVPPEELAREKQELEELLAAARARNDQIETALAAGRDIDINY